jgi:hypothetical protein
VIDAVNDKIYDDGGGSALALDKRQVWLSLAAQSHGKLAIVATEALQERLVLGEDLQHEQTKVSVV